MAAHNNPSISLWRRSARFNTTPPSPSPALHERNIAANVVVFPPCARHLVPTDIKNNVVGAAVG